MKNILKLLQKLNFRLRQNAEIDEEDIDDKNILSLSDRLVGMLIFEKVSQIKIDSQLSQLPFEQKTEGDILHLEVV
ncbi:unknown protein [Simkania negevensis Z]|uniref:Uncharacterized protein n=1 Tax=Simkania negevensis (strain ATCC VR-1471 / DSM 27360 / Z) TaxID=331113 RepID=F8L387_SIMNZ|nr:unknown protein [Simkania negevensis Z]